MFRIFARNIKASPALPENEEVELFRIPTEDHFNRPFLSMTLNMELGNAGSFEFSVDPESSFIDIWKHMRTLVRVEYDEETIFFGRVLTIDRDMFRTKKIHCEGAYTFFMDSVFEGKENGYNEMLSAYITRLLEAHNGCMTDTPEKKIYAGELPGSYSANVTDDQKLKDEKQKFGANKGYKSVKEWLDELPSAYGGFMRVRYNDSDGKLYLDWLKTYFNKEINDQVMSVSSNTVDLSDTIEVDNIFTYLVGVGTNYNYSDGTSGGSGSGEHTISVGSSPSNAGSAGASVGKAKAGTTVTLFAKPFGVSKFVRWNVNSGGVSVSDPTSPSASFTMGNANVSITAVFEGGGGENPHAHYINVYELPRGAGIVYSIPEQAEPGQTVRLYATANTGYKFKGWSTGSNTFTMGDSEVWVSGSFEASSRFDPDPINPVN